MLAESPASTPPATPPSSEPLLLHGYNCTEHYIDRFSVNGQSGGNIFESGPESGGGNVNASRQSESQRLLALNALMLILMCTLSLCACAAPTDSAFAASAQQETGVSAAPNATSAAAESLLLQGYNYTDHYIDSFSVNGQGGGNIFESGPESGGGKSACCVVWQPGAKLPVKIKVRWVAGYCTYREKNPYSFGKPYNEKRRALWKEQDVLITEAVAEKPRALEIHFYRDGRIEAVVTEGDSPPRLTLPREKNYDRPGVSQEFARCPDDTK